MDKRITHLKRDEIDGTSLHLSHLYHYVSAYGYSKEMCNDLADMLKVALKEAATTRQTQIVDQDGECCFHVSPGGYITLMLPWKTYTVIKEEEITITYGTDPEPPPPPPNKLHQPFNAMAQWAMFDGSVEVFPIDSNNHDIMMCIGTEEGPVYITKQQAMDFFGLVEK